MKINLPADVFSHVVKNVYHNVPLAHAARPQGIADYIGHALQKLICHLMGHEFPAERDSAALTTLIEANRSEILQLLASITLNRKGNLPGRPDFGKNDPFEFHGNTYQFVQDKGQLMLLHIQVRAGADHDEVLEYFSLGSASPKKLKSAAIRAIIEHENSNGRRADLREIFLANVADISECNFSHTMISSQNLEEIVKAVSSNPDLPPGARVDVRGAQLVDVKPLEIADLNLDRLVIDQTLALQLIEHGAPYRRVFSQYVESCQMTRSFGFDIASFDLRQVDFSDLDLRNANMRSVLDRNDPAVLRQLKKAVLTPFVRESVELATASGVIVKKPETVTARALDVAGRRSLTPQAFLELAFELEQHHRQGSTLGNIELRNLRLIGDHVRYLNGVTPPDRPETISRKFFSKYDVRPEEVYFGSERHAQLSPVKKDQYDFFGVLMQAVNKKAAPGLMPGDRYAHGDIETLYNHLPCSESLKIDWLNFMVDPDNCALHHPLQAYLSRPGTAYEGLYPVVIDAFADQGSPILGEVHSAAPAGEDAAARAAAQSQREGRKNSPLTLEDQTRLRGYQFDPAQFVALATALSDSSFTAGRMRRLSMRDMTLENGNVRLLLPALTVHGVSHDGGQTSPEIRKKMIALDFFGVMIKAAVQNPVAAEPAMLGSATDYFAQWQSRTVERFVRQLPCHNTLKTELADFLMEPGSRPLTQSLDRYLTRRHNRPHDTGENLLESRDRLKINPSASASGSAPPAEGTVAKVLPAVVSAPARDSVVNAGGLSGGSRPAGSPASAGVSAPAPAVNPPAGHLSGDGTGIATPAQPGRFAQFFLHLTHLGGTSKPAVKDGEPPTVRKLPTVHKPVRLAGASVRPKFTPAISSKKVLPSHDNPKRRTRYFPARAKVPLVGEHFTVTKVIPPGVLPIPQ